MSLAIAAFGVAPNASRVLASPAGTPAGDQLPAVFQPPLTAPVQVLVGAWADAEEAGSRPARTMKAHGPRRRGRHMARPFSQNRPRPPVPSSGAAGACLGLP